MLINRGDARGVWTDIADDREQAIPMRLTYNGHDVNEISDRGMWTTRSFVRPVELQVQSFAGETGTETVASVAIRDASGGSVEFEMSATQFNDWYKRVPRLPDWTDLCKALMRMDSRIIFYVYPNCWHGEFALNRAFYRCSVDTFLREHVVHTSEPEVKISEDEWKNVVFGTRSAL